MPQTEIAGRRYEVITHIRWKSIPLIINGDTVMETVRTTKGVKQQPVLRKVRVESTQLVRVDKSPKKGRRPRKPVELKVTSENFGELLIESLREVVAHHESQKGAA